MKNCTDCIHACWQKTAAGRLHPSGEGKCLKEIILPKLPSSMWYTGRYPASSLISGGHINRREELKDHCVYFEREAND